MISLSRAAIGAIRYLGSTFPLGRPRCDISTRHAPWLRRYCKVGRTARSLVSSVMFPPASWGAFRSRRTSTRLWATSTSRTVSFATKCSLPLDWPRPAASRPLAEQRSLPGLLGQGFIMWAAPLEALAGNVGGQIGDPAGVAPLVVIP